MFKTALSYLFIILGLAVLTGSTSRTAMQYISDHRDVDKWWGTYPCMNGDLVSLCYLDFVSKFRSPHMWPAFEGAQNKGAKNTMLVLFGDSYTWHLEDSNFAGVSVFNYINRSGNGYYHLDTLKKNILLIEISERYLRSYFESPGMINDLRDSADIQQQAGNTENNNKEVVKPVAFKFSELFNKYINQNLQCNLFNYNFIMPMFESKAALNYFLFNRASGDVVISNDRKCLLLKETVTKTDIGSSYSPVSDEEVKVIVHVLDTVYDYYKRKGFSEVYFSAIPNPATIMQPEGYNELIPRVQNDPALRMKIIDVYTLFKNSGGMYYLPGDTHWNSKGKQLWLDLVNNMFVNTSN